MQLSYGESSFYFFRSYQRITGVIDDAYLVLREIQEKLNNPQPDDPFEPDIAMVCIYVRVTKSTVGPDEKRIRR